jgi:hypothetical protein
MSGATVSNITFVKDRLYYQIRDHLEPGYNGQYGVNLLSIGDCGLVPGKDKLLYCGIKCADWVWFPPPVTGSSFPIGTT